MLATILVPQGMAYAELAGLPAVTGFFRHDHRVPRRLRVVRALSCARARCGLSVWPLILAAITPLLAGGDSTTAIALAGMLAVLVGLVEMGLGLWKLGFVAVLLSKKEVQVGYMNGLTISIIVGQLLKLFGLSTDASGFLDEIKKLAKGVLERSHRFLRSNFEPGRRFANPVDFQHQFDAWCDTANTGCTAPLGRSRSSGSPRNASGCARCLSRRSIWIVGS